ncbi:ankyrin repeat-containing domain protein [Coprinopsis sp. MPI-PUGE-AT-0042]|nr:ankyrin repeat-containing domain protein [Coprinopsis sp. MPI-PUGE-AT-0042]
MMLTPCRSIVIKYLDRLEKTSGGAICLAYVYLRYSEPLSVRDVLESFVKQIVERHTDLGPLVESIYTPHERERTKPSQEELQELLSDFIRRGKTIFFILDALDEMRAEDRPHLLRFLASLNARLFITSRPLETLQQQLPEARLFNIAASPSDLKLHTKLFLQHSPDLMALLEGTNLEEHIVERIHHKCDGMFLHAKLQLEALRQCISALDVEETLEAFPTDIEAIYMKTWERILAQVPKHSNLAKLVLLWITHANGEMEIDTLRCAVATSPETHVFDPKRMVPEALILSVCYYTTRDAILPRILELFPIPHALLAHVCIAHVTTCGFQNYGETAIDYEDHVQREEDLNSLIRNDSLLAYAHRSWAHHTSQCDRCTPVEAAVAGLVLNSTHFPLDDQAASLDFGGPLHVAAFYGLEVLIPAAAQLQSPNAQTQDWEDSPLILAVEHGHLACAKALLLLPDTDVNLRNRIGRSALMHAIEEGHIERPQLLQVLLKGPGIDLNAVDDAGWTALILACYWGYLEAVKLLLESPSIDINAADTRGRTALIHATSEGHLEVVKLLLGLPGININAKDTEGWTALMHTMRRGCIEAAILLLGFPDININAGDRGSCTALILAAEYGHAELVKILLGGIDINQVCHLVPGRRHIINDSDNELTALMVAAHEGLQIL